MGGAEKCRHVVQTHDGEIGTRSWTAARPTFARPCSGGTPRLDLMVYENPQQQKGTGSRCASAGDNSPPSRPAPERSTDWTFPVCGAFLGSELPNHLQRTALVLELFLRSHHFVFASFDTLAQKYKRGGTRKRWEQIVNEMVNLGWWIVINLQEGNRKSLKIIVALRRVYQDRPVFNPERDSFEEVREKVRFLTTGQSLLFRPGNQFPETGNQFPGSGNQFPETAAQRPYRGFKRNEPKKNEPKTTTTACGSAPPAAPESSSSLQQPQTGRTDPRASDPSIVAPPFDDQAVAELVERVDKILGPDHRRRVELLVEECGLDIVAHAVSLGETRPRKNRAIGRSAPGPGSRAPPGRCGTRTACPHRGRPPRPRIDRRQRTRCP